MPQIEYILCLKNSLRCRGCCRGRISGRSEAARVSQSLCGSCRVFSVGQSNGPRRRDTLQKRSRAVSRAAAAIPTTTTLSRYWTESGICVSGYPRRAVYLSTCTQAQPEPRCYLRISQLPPAHCPAALPGLVLCKRRRRCIPMPLLSPRNQFTQCCLPRG